MPSSYTPSLRLTLPATGELSGTWGTTVNTGITELTDASIAGYASIAMTDADYTLTVANGLTDQARRMMLNMTGTLTAARNVICPTASKLYVIKNSTTNGFAITLKTSAGTGISIPNGSSMLLMCDGTDVVDAVNRLSNATVTNISYSGTLTGSTGIVAIGTNQFYKDAAGNIGIGTAVPVTPLNFPSGTLVSWGATLGTVDYIQGAAGTVAIGTNGTQKVLVTTAGNVGLAVTPSAWGSNYKVIESSATASIAFSSANASGIGITSNAYNDNTNWRYKITAASARYNITGNTHQWLIAASGTAGAVITYTTPMSLDGSGSLSTPGGGLVATNNAVGTGALVSNTSGANNTAHGYQSLQQNTTGYSNTADGSQALRNIIGGYNNVAVGHQAQTNSTTGNNNTSVGYQSLFTNVGGTNNTASGSLALYSNTSGTGNVAIGASALYGNTTGSGNTSINPLNSSNVVAPVFAPTTENDRLCLGSTGVTNAYVQVAWTVVSDMRDKTDFAPVPHGLDFVTKINPVAYRYKIDRNSTEGHGPVRYGFKAQEVLALEGDSPVIVDNEHEEKLRFNDQSLIAVLVNAIKELKEEFDAYKASHP